MAADPRIAWPALYLEYAVVLAESIDPQYLQFVDRILDDYKSAPVPPFSSNLLRTARHVASQQLDPTGPERGELARRLIETIERMTVAADAAAPWVRRALHQMIRPSGRAAFRMFSYLGMEYAEHRQRQLNRRVRPTPVDFFCPLKSDLIEDWEARLVWPFRTREGGWSGPPMSDDREASFGQLADVWPGATLATPSRSTRGGGARFSESCAYQIDEFWRRWARIIDSVPGLSKLKDIVLDQVRRALSWHFLLVPASRQVAIPLPVFPALLLDAGEEPDVVWLGFTSIRFANETDVPEPPGVAISWEFAEQISWAHRSGIDVWLSRNRTWRGPRFVVGDVELDKVHRSSLFLDLRPVAEVLRNLHVGTRLVDRSAGLPSALGTLALLTSPVPDAATWSTGELSPKPQLDQWKRPHTSTKLPVLFDVPTEWSEPPLEISSVLAKKFLAARAHGVGQRMIFPESASEQAIKRFLSEAASVDQAVFGSDATERRLLELVTVDRLADAGESALPEGLGKTRFISCPDIKWALSSLKPVDVTSDPTSDIVSPRALMTRMREHAAVLVYGPSKSGKTCAIAWALGEARDLMPQAPEDRRPPPRVSFVQWPRYSSWHEECWRFVLRAMNAPQAGIDEFLTAPDWSDKASILLRLLRLFGPDILVITGLEAAFSAERASSGRRPSAQSPMHVLGHLCELLRRPENDPRRDYALKTAFGDLQLVLEVENQPEGSDNFALAGQVQFAPRVQRGDEVLQRTSSALRRIATRRYQGCPSCGWTSKRFERSAARTCPSCDASFSSDLACRRLVSALRALCTLEGEFSRRAIDVACEALGAKRAHIYATKLIRRLEVVQRADGVRVFYRTLSKTPKVVTGLKTGRILRVKRASYHLHPWIRDVVYEDWKNRIRRALSKSEPGADQLAYDFANVNFALATRYHCPFLGGENPYGLFSTRNLQPGTLLRAHWHLQEARLVLQEAIKKNKKAERFPSLLAGINDATLELLRYYHEPSMGLAFQLHSTIRGAEGKLTRRRHWIAYVAGYESLRWRADQGHPAWHVLLADAAAETSVNDMPPGAPPPAALVLRAWAHAYAASHDHDGADREYWLRRCLSGIIQCIFKFRRDTGFPFGIELPEQLVGDRVWQRWEELIDGLKDIKWVLKEPVMFTAFKTAGDAAIEEGRLDDGLRYYSLGLKRMLTVQPDRLYRELVIAAVGCARWLRGDQAARQLGIGRAEVEEVIRRTRRMNDWHRDQVLRFLIYHAAQAFELQPAERRAPPPPVTWPKNPATPAGSSSRSESWPVPVPGNPISSDGVALASQNWVRAVRIRKRWLDVRWCFVSQFRKDKRILVYQLVGWDGWSEVLFHVPGSHLWSAAAFRAPDMADVEVTGIGGDVVERDVRGYVGQDVPLYEVRFNSVGRDRMCRLTFCLRDDAIRFVEEAGGKTLNGIRVRVRLVSDPPAAGHG